MLKLLKHLKPYSWAIVAIFILLFAQAMSDLALPGLMSDIVNIGIQQNGIENAVPEAIRSGELKKITFFAGDSEKAQIFSNYILLDKQSLPADEYAANLKKYPALATETIYKLNTENSTQIEGLNAIFNKYIPVVFAIEKNQISSFTGTTIQIPPNVDPFVLLSQLPAAQQTAIQATVSDKLNAIPAAQLKQYSVAYISGEYKTLGMDMGSIQFNYMIRIGILMLLITLASASTGIIVGVLSARISSGLGRDLRRNVFGRVTSFSNVEFNSFSTASLITRSTNDITQIQMLMVMMFRFVFYAPIMGVGGILKVLNADVSMIWIIGAAIGCVVTVIVIIFSVSLPKFRIMQQLIDKLNLVTREILTGQMVIRAFNTQKYEEQKFDVANTDLTKIGLFVNRIMTFMMPFMMFIQSAIMLLILWVGAGQVDLGVMQVGDMMAFMQYAMMVIFSFVMISIMFIMVPRASVSADRIMEVIETEPVINDPQKPQMFDKKYAGLVEFQDVSFKYPGAEEEILKHVSFTALAGQTTALIGSTGSGKSTVVDLIMRFYDVSGGSIKVGGTDIREVTQNDLRDKIGYVPQKALLFTGTIESNLKYADESASGEEISKSLDIAQAMDFVSSESKGIETMVSQGGMNLSGGQKQRLSIARALVKRPEIYIFDDSFSALDFKTDASLRKALKRETENATVLIVSQRIGPIMGAEQIVVLDNGQIAGKGTHQQLMQSCFVYREIALSQLSAEELAQ
jgi:ATP-binding cassette, subfamily B, multidrug efflux pump